jgi:hypothetical protein
LIFVFGCTTLHEMSTRSLLFLAVALFAVVARAQETPPAAASDTAAKTNAEQAAESQKAAAAEVQRFAFAFAANRETKLKLHETSILRYTNPLRGDVHSALYVWTHEGRPEVVASVSNWYTPRPYLGLAATSLSLEKLVGMRDGQEIWRPRGAGLELRPIPGAEPPADSAAGRLRQMGALAREFTATFKREARYNEGGELRLMTRPLYRYEGTSGDLQDGALYALADGTSPQLNLLIESRKTTSGGFEWQYAFAPNNSVEYRALYKDREVWSLPQVAPPWPNSKNPLNTYTVFPDLQNANRTQELADQLAKAAAADKP